MGQINQELVSKGQKEPREGLRDQGLVHVALAKKLGVVLAEHGWMDDQTKAMEALVNELGSTVAVQADARGRSKAALGDEVQSRAEVKTFIRATRLAAPMAIRAMPQARVSMDQFEAGGRLGQSTPKLVMYLEKIRPAVVALDEALKKYFKGQKPSELLDELKKKLDAAQQSQESTHAALPSDTLKVYETKGRLLQMIEDLNRVARIAFDGQAEIIAQFNKDVLLRARKTRAAQEGGGGGAEGGAQTA